MPFASVKLNDALKLVMHKFLLNIFLPPLKNLNNLLITSI